MSTITVPWLDPIAPLLSSVRFMHTAQFQCPPAAGASRAEWRVRAAHLPRLPGPPLDLDLMNDPLLASFGLDDAGNLAPILAYDLPVFMKAQSLSTDVPLRYAGDRAALTCSRIVDHWAPLFTATPGLYALRRVANHGAKPPQAFWCPRTLIPNDRRVYIGMEWEAEFTSSDRAESATAAVWAAADRISSVSWAPTVSEAPRRFHVETDGSLQMHGREIVTMPHLVQHPATYEALRQLWAPLAREAINTHGRCGLHCHVSRTALVVGASPHSHQHMRTLDYLTACFLQAAMDTGPSAFMYFTGRGAPSQYALWTGTQVPSVERAGARYRHINWNNEHTLEFRFPGPHRFTELEWPCYLHDLCMILIEASRRLVARYEDQTLPALYRGLMSRALNRDSAQTPRTRAAALRAIYSVLNNSPEMYPYAHERFTHPLAPSLPSLRVA